MSILESSTTENKTEDAGPRINWGRNARRFLRHVMPGLRYIPQMRGGVFVQDGREIELAAVTSRIRKYLDSVAFIVPASRKRFHSNNQAVAELLGAVECYALRLPRTGGAA